MTCAVQLRQLLLIPESCPEGTSRDPSGECKQVVKSERNNNLMGSETEGKTEKETSENTKLRRLALSLYFLKKHLRS